MNQCISILTTHEKMKTIIFCETKIRVDQLFANLLKEGLTEINAIHGDKTQN